MTLQHTGRFALLASLVSLTASSGFAQWPTGTTQHLAISDATSDQNQVKLIEAPDGGVWLSWMDGIASGWDIRAQRIDTDGIEVFPHLGVLVADRSFSSTQDYGLDVSVWGNAFLAYRDDSGPGIEVAVSQVSADGTVLWSTPVTSGAGFVAAPKVAATLDGGAFVAWTEDSDTRITRLDASGQVVWASPTTLSPGTGSYFLSDLHPSGDGVIVSVVHQTGGFSSPKHLKAQRLDASGGLAWGAQPIDVFTGGSLQFGNFPTFVPDGSGGAVFAWYSASPSLQAFVQRVDMAGVAQWPADGVPVAETPGRLRTSPHAAFDPDDQSVYVTWTELNSTQSQRGVGVQRFDAGGARVWSNDGIALVPLGTQDITQTRVVQDGRGGGVLAAWNAAPSFGSDQYFAAHLSAAGVLDVGPLAFASVASVKARLASTRTSTGQAVFAWSDQRSDGGDILLQGLDRSGVPGPPTPQGSGFCSASPNSTGVPAELEAFGSNLATANQVTLVATNLPERQFALLLASMLTTAGSTPAGSQGLLCLGGSIGRYNAVPQILLTGDHGSGSLWIDLTDTPTPTTPTTIVAGETWHFQGWYRDLNPGPISNFTPGVSISFQ